MSRPTCGRKRTKSDPSPEHVKQSPKQKIKAPRVAAPAAACVAGRSRGQHMLPQQPSKQTATAPRPLCVIVCVVPKLRLGMRPAKLRFAFPLLQQPSKQAATAPPPKQKIKAPRAVSPEAARRRMTTPVVNTHTQHRSSPQRKPKPLVPSSPAAARSPEPNLLVPSSPEAARSPEPNPLVPSSPEAARSPEPNPLVPSSPAAACVIPEFFPDV